MAKVNIKSEKITPFGGIYYASKDFYARNLNFVTQLSQLVQVQTEGPNTLHPSSIPWNPLCLSGFQGLKGTIPPFITLHHPSYFLKNLL